MQAPEATPTSRLRIAIPVALGVILAAVGAYFALSHTSAPGEITYVAQTSNTQHYTVTIQVVSPQNMYTPQQVKDQNPTDGEVMFNGTMVMPAGMSGMNMSMSASSYPAGWRHIEVHIYDRSTNAVVKGALPVMSVVDEATGKTQALPSVEMQSVTEGAPDLHYGNNAYLPSGTTYVLRVTIAGESTSFTFKL